MRFFTLLVTTIAICVFISCNVNRVVKPLPKGEHQVNTSFGGAIIKLGSAPIPIPLTNVSYAYGVSEKTSVYAGVHTTAMLFGVLQTDLGATYQLNKQNRFIPGISVSPIANIMFDTWQSNFKCYPQLDVNSFWNYGSNNNKLIYASLNNWFELSKTKAHEQEQKLHWLPYITLGHQWQLKKYVWQVEAKYIAPNQNNKNIVVDYVGINNKGALGIYLGVSRKF